MILTRGNLSVEGDASGASLRREGAPLWPLSPDEVRWLSSAAFPALCVLSEGRRLRELRSPA